MNDKLKTYLLILLILACLSASRDKEPAVPYGLMVEFIREPEFVRILDHKPEFTWIVPAKAGRQTAYQILISSAEEKINKNSGDTWDSGKVLSNNSAEVEPATELQQDMIYFWKVRIWDKNGNPSKYSEIQKFTTGGTGSYATTRNKFLSTLTRADKVVKDSQGNFFADFGKDAFGTLVIGISPLRNETLTVHLGEKQDTENHIDRNPGGSIRYQKTGLQVTPGQAKYVVALPPDTRNTGAAAVHLPDSFGVVTPFRYAEVENCSTEITEDNIFRKSFMYYFDDDESSFSSSDTVLNRIWDLCKYSIKATSFTGIYIDGDRERIPYEADAYINQLGHYYTDREYSMGRATNEYFIDHPTWPTEWILHTVLLFHNDLMFTGNTESIREYYDELKFKTLHMLARKDGLISSQNANGEIMKSLGFSDPKERIRDIVDWPPAQKDTGWKLAGPDGERDGYDMAEINTVVNAFYYRNLVLMSEIAGILGKNDDSDFYRQESERVRKAFNDKLLSKKKKIYIDGENSDHSSLHANMMALAFDLVPEENKKAVTDFIKTRGMACSVYGSQYLLEGLYRAGEADYAFSLLTSLSDRGWFNMIRSGSTITMEAWDMKYKPNSDWNHAWGAAPANIIPGYMWGISPAKPGFEKCIIRPRLASLKNSSIRVPTIRGPITAEFRDTGKSREYRISVPGNMECDFVTPEGKIIRLAPGSNKIVLK